MELSKASFWGFKRENGRVGVRNHVLILPVDDLSNALPTVGLAPQPEVVSDSPHLVETHRSFSGRSSRRNSEAHCKYSLAAFEARWMVS